MSREDPQILFADPEHRARLEAGRPTWAIVDLDALDANLGVLAEAAGGVDRLLAVVKADAYGLGAGQVAAALGEAGVTWFGVASLEEGVRLRAAGIEGRILLLGGFFPVQADEIVRRDLTPALFDRDAASALAAASGGAEISVHLEVDTGMHRLGVPHGELGSFLDAIPELAPGGGLRIEGVFTHLACADEEGEEAAATTRRQLERFEAACRSLRERGHPVFLRHAANSAGLLHLPGARFDLHRTGLGLYGADPRGVREMAGVLHWCSRILHTEDLAEGERVGYGATWKAEGPRRVATLPMGYHDGFDRRLSNLGCVRIRGRRCPVAGRVSMDLLSVDVSGLEAVERGERAWLLGGPPGEDPPVGLAEMAEATGRIPYEVLCGLSPRVPRLYRRDGRIVAASID